MGISQLLVYLPAARPSQVTRAHAQQGPSSRDVGWPEVGKANAGWGGGGGRGVVSGLRSDTPLRVCLAAGQTRPRLPASQVEVMDRVVGELLGWETEGSPQLAGQGTGAREGEDACSSFTLGSEILTQDPACTALPMESCLLRVLEAKNRNLTHVRRNRGDYYELFPTKE